MYAIISDGGRQYKVTAGQFIDLDYREAAEEGAELRFERVLAVGGEEESLRLGTPLVEGASVVGRVLGTQLGPKIFIQKYKRRKNFDRRTGHRQKYTRVQIDAINV